MAPPPRSAPVAAPRPPPAVRPSSPTVRRPRQSPTALIAAGLLFAVAVAAMIWAFLPRHGTLAVNISGPGGTAVGDVSVLIDQVEAKCPESACRVPNLAAGTHTVRVVAPGYAKAADKMVVIQGGQTAVVEFSLVADAKGTAAGAVSGTGVRVGALGPDLRLRVDGVDRGPLPAAATDLEPGEHTIRIDGSDRFQPYEEKLAVEAGSVRLLTPELRPRKGLLEVVLGDGADGASVTLVCGTDRRVLGPPTKIEVDLERSCVVTGRKAGLPDFSEEVRFAGTRAEATITVRFSAGGAAVQPPGPTPTPPGPKPPAWLPVPGPKPPTPPVAAGGTGTISINSIPVSSVLVDGKPVGQTPTRVTVAVGPHSVTFVHPEKGRKTVGVQVTAGGNSVAATRF